MFRRTAAAALAFGMVTAGVQAAEHEVAIIDGAFYPEITYVQPGDTVLVYNADEVPRRVFGDEFTFISPKLMTEDAFTVTIVEDMPNEYYGKTGSGDIDVDTDQSAASQAQTDEDDNPMRGVFSFAPPPLASD
jgi:plastocyanin